MTPIHHSHLPPFEGNQNHQAYLHPFFPTYETAPFPYPIFLNPSQQGGGSHDPTEQQHSHHQQQKANEQYFPFSTTGSWDHSSSTVPSTTKLDGSSKKETPENDPTKNGSSKWMPSKMRLMKKMMNSGKFVTSKPRKKRQTPQDQQQSNTGDGNSSNNCLNSSSSGIIRVCSDCNTTKTPLWRSGPQGPKSLCNACGIRQRKARRAMAAAAAAGVISVDTPANYKVHKAKRLHNDCSIPFKKRCKFTSVQARDEEPSLDDFSISLSKNSAFQRVFPQDEKEAAILLMALSCGLICG